MITREAIMDGVATDDDLVSDLHDAEGNPVRRDQSPGDLRGFPFADQSLLPKLPGHVEARMLNGNWYGRGPEIVLWDTADEVHIMMPVSMVKHCALYLQALKRAAAMKRRGDVEPIGGYRVS
jgi:hypothetical protein